MNIKEEFESLIEGMSVEDMPKGAMQDIAEACGTKVAIALMKNFKGVWFYIPKRDAFSKIVDKIIINHFNRSNAKKLARICDISERHVYEIVEKEDICRKEKKGNLKQFDLFETWQF